MSDTTPETEETKPLSPKDFAQAGLTIAYLGACAAVGYQVMYHSLDIVFGTLDRRFEKKESARLAQLQPHLVD